jgi:hypothetical protein
MAKTKHYWKSAKKGILESMAKKYTIEVFVDSLEIKYIPPTKPKSELKDK